MNEHRWENTHDGLPKPPEPKHFKELNALRGLAALIVIFYHFRILFPIHDLTISAWLIWMGVLRLVFSGPESVIFFFILSGFVLSLPFVRGTHQPYGIYLVRRIYRIYLPYLGALAIGISCAALFHNHPLPLSWVRNTWSKPVELAPVISHVLFLGDYRGDQFNTAFWSLVVEMRLSILFPFFCLFILKFRPRTVLPMLIALSCAGMALDHKWPMKSQPWLTLHYAAMFGLGILMAANLGRLSDTYHRLSKHIQDAAIGGGLLLFAFGTAGTAGAEYLGKGYMQAGEWLVALGCFLLIVSSLNSPGFSKLLSSPIPQWLGNISYSMYLMHSMVLFAVLHLLYRRIPLLGMLPVFLAATFVVSWLFFLSVERPSARLSRSVGRRPMPNRRERPEADSVPELAGRS